jgi:hypothetical protein
MEVASMLAAEPFSDEPVCVCPVIAEFLRTYNDEVDDGRRQDLYPYASMVVGTRDNPSTERRRANKLADWWLKGRAPRAQYLFRVLWRLVPSSAWRDIEIAHRAGRWAARHRERHPEALVLVEQMSGHEHLHVDDVVVAAEQREVVAS